MIWSVLELTMYLRCAVQIPKYYTGTCMQIQRSYCCKVGKSQKNRFSVHTQGSVEFSIQWVEFKGHGFNHHAKPKEMPFQEGLIHIQGTFTVFEEVQFDK